MSYFSMWGFDRLLGSNVLLINVKETWADEATADTENDVDITLPDTIPGNNLVEVLVHNPSANTSLTVVAKVQWVDADANTRYSELTRFVVAEESGEAVLVQGLLMAEGARLTLSNDDALGTGEGFDAYVQARVV